MLNQTLTLGLWQKAGNNYLYFRISCSQYLLVIRSNINFIVTKIITTQKLYDMFR